MRKIDEPHEGFLYRVVERPRGSDEEWKHSNYGTTGRPRTYMTLSAARGQKTTFENAQQRAIEYRGYWNPRRERPLPELTELEFAVQRSPVLEWEVISDGEK